MKVLMFDIRESEKPFFERNKFMGFDFVFFEEKLDKNTKINDELFEETDVISVYRSSMLRAISAYPSHAATLNSPPLPTHRFYVANVSKGAD